MHATQSNGAGRTYTSKFRGVHQTFPTKRWEAQFRRNGKPTSLGAPGDASGWAASLLHLKLLCFQRHGCKPDSFMRSGVWVTWLQAYPT